jgi:hypothetical protein
MNCLIDYIGIEGCGSESPDSGYYINRLLPGVTLESIDKIASADQQTYLGVWQDIQKRAALRFESHVIRAFQERYQIKTIQESFDLGKFIDTADVTAAAAKWRGFTIELVDDNIHRWVDSALQCINLQSISLYRSAVTVALSAKVFNLETGELLATIAIPANAAAGWTTVNVSQRFYAPRILVAYDSTLINSVEFDLTSDLLRRFHDCACEWFGDCKSVIQGAQSASLSSTVKDADITTGLNMYGLSAVFSVGCSYYSIVCQNKLQFLMPWAFLLGRELMWERAYSSRINRWTIGIDAAKAKELMADFDKFFQEELYTVVEAINLNTGDCCLDCNAPLQYRESMM